MRISNIHLYSMRLLLASLIISTLTVPSWAAQAEKTITSRNTPATSIVVETPSEAIWHWKQGKKTSVSLLLLSNDPFLFPVPKEARAKAITLLQKADLNTYQAVTSGPVVAPLILPGMALDLAIRAKLVKEVIWVIPVKPMGEPPTLETFHAQALSSNVMTKAEADSFTEEEGLFIGRVRGVKFIICGMHNLPDLSQTTQTHIDMTFFSKIYQNEIKGGLYGLVYKTLTLLKKTGLKDLRATISASNNTGKIALRTRFLAKDISSLLQNPGMLERQLPELWQLRSQNLYLNNFFQDEKIIVNLSKMENISPDDAAVKFELYEGYKSMKKGGKALDYLAEAIKLDPVYAYEYPQLAQLALEKQQPVAALQMLDKAIAAQPLDPFLKLLKIKILIEVNHPAGQTLELIEEVKGLPWSPIYDPEIKATLGKLMNDLAKEQNQQNLKKRLSAEDTNDVKK